MKRLDYKNQDCETWGGLFRELGIGVLVAALIVAVMAYFFPEEFQAIKEASKWVK